MATASVTIEATFPARFLDGLLQGLEGPLGGRVGRDVVRLLRDSVVSEFRDEHFLRPGGGSTPWKARAPFGPNQKSGPLLGGPTGVLGSAWAGGPGGFSEVKPLEVEVGISHPAAAMHRGGAGTSVRPNQTTRVRAKKPGARGLPAMFWFHGMQNGVWISPEKLRREGLVIPARPHAGGNPKLCDDIARRVLEGLKTSGADA